MVQIFNIDDLATEVITTSNNLVNTSNNLLNRITDLYTKDITFQKNVTVNSNLTIGGVLTVNGTTTSVNTDAYSTEILEIINTSISDDGKPLLKISDNSTSSTRNIIEVYKEDIEVFSIDNSGKLSTSNVIVNGIVEISSQIDGELKKGIGLHGSDNQNSALYVSDAGDGKSFNGGIATEGFVPTFSREFPRQDLTSSEITYVDGKTFRSKASSVKNDDPLLQPWYLFDGTKEKQYGWTASSNNYYDGRIIPGQNKDWVMTDMGEPIILKQTKIYPSLCNLNGQPKKFTIYATNDSTLYESGAIDDAAWVSLYTGDNANVGYIKYPREALPSDSHTYSGETIKVQVKSSSTENPDTGSVFTLFDNDKISLNAWASEYNTYKTDGTPINTYRNDYSGEYLMMDLGEKISLDSLKIYPKPSPLTKLTPKEFKVYATNNQDCYNNSNINHNDWIEVFDTNQSEVIPPIEPTIFANSIKSSGRPIENTYDKYFAFTSTTGTNSITFHEDTVCDILIVGGGGSGGYYYGGGGGAGAVIYATGVSIPGSSTPYNIVVGDGGVYDTSTHTGGQGGESTAFGATARGGARGGYATWTGNNLVNGLDGGSGSGAMVITSGSTVPTGGASSIDLSNDYGSVLSTSTSKNIYGNAGGASFIRSSGTIGNSGGGGGAGTTGFNGSVTSGSGGGGNGIDINITGTTVYYGAGGGGSGYSTKAGDGGIGGGGGGSSANIADAKGLGGLDVPGGTKIGGDGGDAGIDGYVSTIAGHGANKTGSGGGGGYWYTGSLPGNGGSGIVIIRWTTPTVYKHNVYDTHLVHLSPYIF